jgi:hypothetical protein
MMLTLAGLHRLLPQHDQAPEGGRHTGLGKVVPEDLVTQGSLLILAGVVLALAFAALAAYMVRMLIRASVPARNIAAILAAVAMLLGVLPAILIALHG